MGGAEIEQKEKPWLAGLKSKNSNRDLRSLFPGSHAR
jgi:hypothetical protein